MATKRMLVVGAPSVFGLLWRAVRPFMQVRIRVRPSPNPSPPLTLALTLTLLRAALEGGQALHAGEDLLRVRVKVRGWLIG